MRANVRKKPKAVSHYEVLGLTKEATPEEIRSSYKKLAIRFHPDKNPDGTETFQSINRAHEVLADADKRKIYDRYGEDGVFFTENTDFQGPSGSLQSRWGKAALVWLAFVIVDYIFGLPLEWLGIGGATVWLIAKLNNYKAELSLGIIVLDWLLYWLIPTPWMAQIASGFIYASVLIWSGVVSEQMLFGGNAVTFDVSVAVWCVLMLFDFWTGRISPGWSFFGANAITFSVAFLVLMVLFFQTDLIPDVGSSFVLSNCFRFLGMSVKSNYIAFLGLIIWVAIWIIDYFLNFSIEWIPLTILACLNLFGWSYSTSALYVTATLLTYWYIPIWIYSYVATSVLHLVSLAVLRFATVEDPQHKPFTELLKSVKLWDVAVFIVMQFIDLYWRNRPEKLVLMGAMSAVLGVFLLIGPFINMGPEEEEESEEGPHSPHFPTEFQDQYSTQQTRAPSQQEWESPKQETESNDKKTAKGAKMCQNCGAMDTKLRRCSGCNRVFYCSTACQKEHRPMHKQDCGSESM